MFADITGASLSSFASHSRDKHFRTGMPRL